MQNRPYRELSLQQYHDTLAGRCRSRRSGGARLLAGQRGRAYAGSIRTSHAPRSRPSPRRDGGVLFAFAATWSARLGALLTATLYLFANAVAYAPEGYAIYHTNDYLVVLGWFAAVYSLGEGRWPLACAAIFVAAWAKESIGLAVMLAAFEAWRGRLSWRGGAACALPLPCRRP